MQSPEELRQYYLRVAVGKVEETVKESLEADPTEVVYGAQSVNVRMPSYLRRFSEDWDIYSHNPEETAKELETLLDKTFGGDFFEVRPARHEGTFKVVSKVTKKGIADITLPSRTITYQTVDDVNYATLEEQVTDIRKVLADPKYRFRWNRDKETLQRIVLCKSQHPKKEPTIKELRALETEQSEELGEDEKMERDILGSLATKRPKEIRPGIMTTEL